MASVTIEGLGEVQVDDAFLGLSPEDQALTVDEIIRSVAQSADVTPGDGGAAPDDSVAPVPGETDEAGLLDRISIRFSERGVDFQEIIAAQEAGEQTLGESIGQVVGKVGIGAVFDLLGETVSSAATSAFDLLESAAPETVGAAMEAFSEVVDTDLVQGGLEAAGQGIEAYQEWAARNPRASRNLDAIANIALLLAPVKGKPAIGKPSGAIARRAEGLELRATAQVAEKGTDFLNELVSPKPTTEVLEGRVLRTQDPTRLAAGRVEPTPFEAQMARNVGEIPGVSPKNGPFTNNRAINAAVDVEAEVLKREISRSPFPISRQAIIDESDALKQTLKDNPLLTGDAAKTGEKVAAMAAKFIRNNPKTGAGMLQARKQFDAEIRKQSAKKGRGVFDPSRETALTIAVRETRSSMNKLIADSAPGVAVRQSLAKQHSLLTATENLTAKIARTNEPKLKTAFTNAGKALGFKGTLFTLMATMGIGASTAAAIGGTALAGFGVRTAALSAGTKKVAANLLRKVDKAIRVTTDPKLLLKLRLDRAALLELSEEFTNQEE